MKSHLDKRRQSTCLDLSLKLLTFGDEEMLIQNDNTSTADYKQKRFSFVQSNSWPSYQFTDAIKDRVDDLLSDGVVTTSIVISRILFARDHLLWVEQLAVGTSTDLIWNKMFP